MKLIRFGPSGQEKPGVIMDPGARLDVSAMVRDFDGDFFASGGLLRLREWLADHAQQCPPVGADVRLGSCIARPSKIIGIGLNYAKHAVEAGYPIPAEPVIFLKAPSALSGPDDEIVSPQNSKELDYEVELAVVIGRKATAINESDASNYIAGYTVANDVSERGFQHGMDGLTKAKSFDTFFPLGPYLATRDEIPTPNQLRIWLKVNGETRQDSNTADMIFPVNKLVSAVSHFMTLYPGDVISTGTPSGVALGMKPAKFLRPGDQLELGIEGLGTASPRVIALEEVASRAR